MKSRVAGVLGTHPDLAFDLYTAASELVDDFDDFGPALQANLDGAYDEDTAIERLRRVRSRVLDLLRKRS